jgi:hypothetical protein
MEGMNGQSYLAFVWTPNGYELHEEHGEPPQTGQTIENNGKTWRVAKVAPSPLPGDDRLCVYLQG